MGPKQKVLTGHQILLPKHSANDIIMRALLLWEFLSCKIKLEFYSPHQELPERKLLTREINTDPN